MRSEASTLVWERPVSSPPANGAIQLKPQHLVTELRHIRGIERNSLVALLSALVWNIEASLELLTATPEPANRTLATIKDALERVVLFKTGTRGIGSLIDHSSNIFA